MDRRCLPSAAVEGWGVKRLMADLRVRGIEELQRELSRLAGPTAARLARNAAMADTRVAARDARELAPGPNGHPAQEHQRARAVAGWPVSSTARGAQRRNDATLGRAAQPGGCSQCRCAGWAPTTARFWTAAAARARKPRGAPARDNAGLKEFQRRTGPPASSGYGDRG